MSWGVQPSTQIHISWPMATDSVGDTCLECTGHIQVRSQWRAYENNYGDWRCEITPVQLAIIKSSLDNQTFSFLTRPWVWVQFQLFPYVLSST